MFVQSITRALKPGDEFVQGVQSCLDRWQLRFAVGSAGQWLVKATLLDMRTDVIATQPNIEQRLDISRANRHVTIVNPVAIRLADRGDESLLFIVTQNTRSHTNALG